METERIIELVNKTKSGDKEAFGELYSAFYGRVERRISIITGNEEQAKDLAQETFLTAYQKLDQLKTPEAFPGWLTTISTNQACAYLRAKKPEALFSEIDAVSDPEGDSEGFEARLSYEKEFAQPEAEMEKKESQRLIREIMNELPDTQRLAITLFYYDDMKISEIASVTGINENTIKTALRRGKKQIEEKVRNLRKKGTKLYSLSPFAFFLWLFLAESDAAAAMLVPAAGAAAITGAAAAAAETATAIGTAGAVTATAGAAGTAAGGMTGTAAAMAGAAGTSASIGAAAGAADASAGAAGAAFGLKTAIIAVVSLLAVGGAGLGISSALKNRNSVTDAPSEMAIVITTERESASETESVNEDLNDEETMETTSSNASKGKRKPQPRESAGEETKAPAEAEEAAKETIIETEASAAEDKQEETPATAEAKKDESTAENNAAETTKASTNAAATKATAETTAAATTKAETTAAVATVAETTAATVTAKTATISGNGGGICMFSTSSSSVDDDIPGNSYYCPYGAYIGMADSYTINLDNITAGQSAYNFALYRDGYKCSGLATDPSGASMVASCSDDPNWTDVSWLSIDAATLSPNTTYYPVWYVPTVTSEVMNILGLGGGMYVAGSGSLEYVQCGFSINAPNAAYSGTDALCAEKKSNVTYAAGDTGVVIYAYREGYVCVGLASDGAGTNIVAYASPVEGLDPYYVLNLDFMAGAYYLVWQAE